MHRYFSDWLAYHIDQAHGCKRLYEVTYIHRQVTALQLAASLGLHNKVEQLLQQSPESVNLKSVSDSFCFVI